MGHIRNTFLDTFSFVTMHQYPKDYNQLMIYEIYSLDIASIN